MSSKAPSTSESVQSQIPQPASPSRFVAGSRKKDARVSTAITTQTQQGPKHGGAISKIVRHTTKEQLEAKIKELEDEQECCAGPKELYDKLAKPSNYLPPMGFLETVDNAWDAGAKNVWSNLDTNTYIQQDDGCSFMKGEGFGNEFIYNKPTLSEKELNDIKRLIKRRLSPLKELKRSDDNIGFNNWGLKGELAYHKSHADIYSWNQYWFIHININIQEQMESNLWTTGLTINIYEKDKIADEVRKRFLSRLIAKEPKWQETSGTLIHELFTENKPNIIREAESGDKDITQNHLLWTKQWFQRRYFMKDTERTLIFNGEKLKPLIIENEIDEDKKVNRIKTNKLTVYKNQNYLYYSINGKYSKLKKYNLTTGLPEKCLKKPWDEYTKAEYMIGKVNITNILCNKLPISETIRNLYHPEYENATDTKIILDGIIIAEEPNYKSSDQHYKHIFTLIDIIDTCGKTDLKKHILEKCTITKQQGKSKTIFYEACSKIRKSCFSDNEIYYSWNNQVTNFSHQDKLKYVDASNGGGASTDGTSTGGASIGGASTDGTSTDGASNGDGMSTAGASAGVVDLAEVVMSRPVIPPLPPKEDLTKKDICEFIKSKENGTQISFTKEEFEEFMDRFN
jgi:hypothetical protein